MEALALSFIRFMQGEAGQTWPLPAFFVLTTGVVVDTLVEVSSYGIKGLSGVASGHRCFCAG